MRRSIEKKVIEPYNVQLGRMHSELRQKTIRVNPRNELVSFFSKLPFNVEEDKRIDVALAICAVNYWLADGSFDYDLSDGSILFRLTSSYKESTLGEALFEYMVVVSAATVDNYNDKFFMMSKGMMTYQQFIEAHDD